MSLYKKTVKPEAGWTLIELMIVIVILAIMGGAVLWNISDSPEKARVVIAKTDINTIISVLKLYKTSNSSYPTTQQGLKALIEKTDIPPIPKYFPKGGYFERAAIPKDPWGNEYIYRSPGEDGREYEIISLGSDGKEGGEGFANDIKSWDMDKE
ncbi:MAG: type II secretion system major pseudopilin GspG [Nitrospirae bacterium]|nr:type II secretion system major pseudopilin GspG [Nitrospirota bacterium]